MQRQKAIIAYDITDNARRYRVHRTLKAWGLAAQYSVFECELEPRSAEALLKQLGALIEPTEDSLLLAWLDKQRHTRLITMPSIGRTYKSPLWYEG